ncbi:hypothetical protein [Paenibacillus sp. XY044]|uniref:hypothetical protein n=1 Tax=Paenibacillus sp. XY044 TaxID=2026089 RepID=UPI000B990761|nr:hypothetical protein [Paenibacillus sp. XY044]OZB96202.1 hypothetical protein CJP46_09855 [Paenibacillus sp. XY044]
MSPTDKRNKLSDEVFTYRATKDNKVIIYWQGKQVTILSGKESERFLQQITNADPIEAQLIMAKATGNFKRGNEKGPRK